jgi:hypothetical protein
MHQWEPGKASRELKELLRPSWFAEVLMPRLSFGALRDDEALAIISGAAGATPKARPQLRMVLDYMEVAGLIEREGDLVRASETVGDAPIRSRVPTTQAVADDPPVRQTSSGQTPLLIQGLLQQLPTDGLWTRPQAKKWLKLAEMTFELVYDLGPDDDLMVDRGNQE